MTLRPAALATVDAGRPMVKVERRSRMVANLHPRHYKEAHHEAVVSIWNEALDGAVVGTVVARLPVEGRHVHHLP
jgi:hypothetical protein